jgi:cellulose synthase/poly-beta-1,6-N-acetylglucosamine synthase-like glycosyltransferase
MGWLEIFCLLAILIYTVFLGAVLIAALRAKDAFNPAFHPRTKITVIIPARNEENNIAACVESLAHQYYPAQLLEIIVVNDHSTDHTLDRATNALKKHFSRYTVISLGENEQGKKMAIQKAVSQAWGDIIVTRDADTVCDQASWLKRIAFEFETNPCDLLIMPVTMNGRNTFSSAFQKFENLAISTIGFGMARNHLPMVCSGANLAYRKDFFIELNPYQGNQHIASGDDMFLLLRALKKKAIIHTSNNPVQTVTEPDLKSALRQRLRWASKGRKILTRPIFFCGLTLFLGNLAALIALLCLLIDGSYLHFGLFTLSIKLIIDFLLLFLSARMFKIRFNPAWYIPAFLFNLAYTPVITTLSFFVKPAWKGRS